MNRDTIRRQRRRFFLPATAESGKFYVCIGADSAVDAYKEFELK